jgi:nuclease S1
MVSTKAVIGLLALSTVALLPSGAWAWGGEGHRIIALIAADRLTPAARAEVSDLLGGDARGRMEEVSTWADEIRRGRPKTAPWHYVNIEISTNGYDAARDCPAGDCVVAQVQKDERILADHRLAKSVRAEALRFLIHFVGDLHQPLHCADNHDRGGNEVRVLVGAEETNLHAVWDTNVVAALGQNPDQVASDLAAQIAPEEAKSWSRGAPEDWSNESSGVAKRVIYAALPGEGGTTAPIVLPRDYAARQRPVTAVQLERAGVRLAVMLNTALGSPVHAAAVQTIAPETASSHLGETVTVKGAVADVHTARSGVTFIDIGGRYPHNAFTAVIFSGDAAKFPDVGALSGRVVEITGLVRLYKGKPEIILSAASQLKAE